jgi:hypothetical protein
MTMSLRRDPREIPLISPASYLPNKLSFAIYPEQELHNFSFVSVFDRDITVKETEVDF